MPRKVKLLLLLSAFLLTMCKNYDQGGPIVATNGLSCQNFTEYGIFSRKRGAECFYACPDGTIRQPDISGNFSTESTLYSASKQDLDSQFCSLASQPVSTISPVSTLPLLTVPTSSPTETPTPQVSATATAEISPTTQAPQEPLLSGNITMCDQTVNLISFRMVQPVPDLTGKVVKVQISGQDTDSCEVNPVNTSLLTCNLPSPITFPARVVVSLDGAVVNDFTYNGIGCILVDTAIPSGPTPTP